MASLSACENNPLVLEDESEDVVIFKELDFVLIGCHGAGKNTAGNIILNKKEFNYWTSWRKQPVKKETMLGSRKITLIRTAGWSGRSSKDEIKQQIIESVRSSFADGPNAILLVIRIGCKDSLKPTLSIFMNEEGERSTYEDTFIERALNSTVVLFTNEEELDKLHLTIERYITDYNLEGLIEKCEGRYCVLSDKKSHKVQNSKLFKQLEEMISENRHENFQVEERFMGTLEKIVEKKTNLITNLEKKIARLEEKMSSCKIKRDLESCEREIEKLQKTIKQKNKELQEVKAYIEKLSPKVKTDNQTQTDEDNDPQRLLYEAINKDNLIEELSGTKAQLEKELRTAEEELKSTEGKWRRTEEELRRTKAELEEQLRRTEEELRRTKEELEKAKKAEESKKTIGTLRTENLLKLYKELNRKSYCTEEIIKKNIRIDRPYEMTQRSCIASSANPSTPNGQAFITKHRMELVNRLGLLPPILTRLHVRGVLSQEEIEIVEIKPTKSQQNQALLNMVVRKGARAQEYFYLALRESDLLLVEDLCNS
ncbi:intracellular protein transport protein USO1 isoform X2 [Salmo trutta]|uniref:intracellular protein transport protein USO1 isoform X2 n=1 Tax=Salmo trutta TaxID=8032 RepID=UPI0011314E16|nr:intracellular protein transport protein USO1-like isoform X2 [Salmo trutta]